MASAPGKTTTEQKVASGAAEKGKDPKKAVDDLHAKEQQQANKASSSQN